jgi:hypothetical protein
MRSALGEAENWQGRLRVAACLVRAEAPFFGDGDRRPG